MRVAVIDLGTNTFHLLIADIKNKGQFETLKRIRKYVYIGEEGVDILGEKPLQRAFETLMLFKQTATEFEVDEIIAFGTAALRTASNSNDFITKVREEIGIEIQLISGEKEADLIYLGTKKAIPPTSENFLIMDIGGGSVEFIIANDTQKLWAASFPIGVSVLFNEFHHADPISTNEINNLLSFVNHQLTTLYQALSTFPAHILVGASGTFDVLSNIMGSTISNYPHAEIIDLTHFPNFYDIAIKSSLAERLQLKEVPKERAKLISVALILVKLILEKAKIHKLIVSAYAMKEGILSEVADKSI